jgi:hypothetical protein
MPTDNVSPRRHPAGAPTCVINIDVEDALELHRVCDLTWKQVAAYMEIPLRDLLFAVTGLRIAWHNPHPPKLGGLL